MAKWAQLIAARDRKHLSQMEAAERLNVGLVTYQRWELGKRRPQPQHMRRIYEIFGPLLEENDNVSIAHETASPVTDMIFTAASPMADTTSNEQMVSRNQLEETQEFCSFLAATLTSHLWSLALMHHSTCTEKRIKMRQTIEEFDSMNADNKNYQITRREALWSLATLPMMTLGLTVPGSSISSNQYSNALAHCAASLEPCWELHRSNDPAGIRLAFKCTSKYIALLKTISHNSPVYRQEALDLATRYALVQTLLGWICAGPVETLQYAKNAVALSKETDDISLQLSAYSKLAWAYFYLKKDGLALSTAQEAHAHLTRYTLSSNAQALHPCVYAGIHSALALMLARNGQSPDKALGIALEANPQESFACITSKRSTLLLEAGWAYCYYGDQTKALEMLEGRVNPETLLPKVAQSQNGQIETMNVMTLSSLRSKDRDMEKIIHLWIAGIEGARTLKSDLRFNESLAAYDLMEAIWPGEKRIVELRDHITHWDE
jgi:transcriptional regulator with XRE-family HTH domain